MLIAMATGWKVALASVGVLLAALVLGGAWYVLEAAKAELGGGI